jgi:hypothetical protein
MKYKSECIPFWNMLTERGRTRIRSIRFFLAPVLWKVVNYDWQFPSSSISPELRASSSEPKDPDVAVGPNQNLSLPGHVVCIPHRSKKYIVNQSILLSCVFWGFFLHQSVRVIREIDTNAPCASLPPKSLYIHLRTQYNLTTVTTIICVDHSRTSLSFSRRRLNAPAVAPAVTAAAPPTAICFQCGRSCIFNIRNGPNGGVVHQCRREQRSE